MTVETIADIARIAGVSKATVSRALNDSPLVGAETKERVRAIAEAHRFQMNDPARRLSLRRANVIGLVTHEYKADSSVPDTFMLEIMSGIANALREARYDLLVIQVSPHDTDWASRYLDTGRVDGFILFSALCTQRQLQTLVERRAPFIAWGPPRADVAYSTVRGDSFTGGRLATEHLLASGRRRIAFLGGPGGDAEVQDRFRGYEAALRAADRTVDPALVAYGAWHHGGASSLAALLDRAPDLDAIFACSDLMAIAAMDTLRERGRRVPDDVAVVGYDDVSFARFSNPPLTTVRQDAPLAGRLLARNLVQQLESGAITSVSIPAALVVREST